MLPHPSSPEFPAALKAAREARGMSRAELARGAGIHSVMPRRYEEPNCGEFTRPSERTVLALNRALGFVQEAPAESSTVLAEETVPLRQASVDQIVAELRRRGIAVTLTFPA